MTLKEQKEIEKAKQLLKDNGYFTDNLWHVEDVKGKFNCDDETAQSILKDALENDATMEQIWLAIDIAGESEGLEVIEED
jgi:hypothetical protein